MSSMAIHLSPPSPLPNTPQLSINTSLDTEDHDEIPTHTLSPEQNTNYIIRIIPSPSPDDLISPVAASSTAVTRDPSPLSLNSKAVTPLSPSSTQKHVRFSQRPVVAFVLPPAIQADTRLVTYAKRLAQGFGAAGVGFAVKASLYNTLPLLGSILGGLGLLAGYIISCRVDSNVTKRVVRYVAGFVLFAGSTVPDTIIYESHPKLGLIISAVCTAAGILVMTSSRRCCEHRR